MQKNRKPRKPSISQSAANFIHSVSAQKDMQKTFLKLSTDDLKFSEVKKAFLSFLELKRLGN